MISNKREEADIKIIWQMIMQRTRFSIRTINDVTQIWPIIDTLFLFYAKMDLLLTPFHIMSLMYPTCMTSFINTPIPVSPMESDALLSRDVWLRGFFLPRDEVGGGRSPLPVDSAGETETRISKFLNLNLNFLKSPVFYCKIFILRFFSVQIELSNRATVVAN